MRTRLGPTFEADFLWDWWAAEPTTHSGSPKLRKQFRPQDAKVPCFIQSIPAKCSDLVGTASISESKSARKSERSDFPDFQKGGKNICQEKVNKNRYK